MNEERKKEFEINGMMVKCNKHMDLITFARKYVSCMCKKHARNVQEARNTQDFGIAFSTAY